MGFAKILSMKQHYCDCSLVTSAVSSHPNPSFSRKASQAHLVSQTNIISPQQTPMMETISPPPNSQKLLICWYVANSVLLILAGADLG
jgi:hypothetical protein